MFNYVKKGEKDKWKVRKPRIKGNFIMRNGIEENGEEEEPER